MSHAQGNQNQNQDRKYDREDLKMRVKYQIPNEANIHYIFYIVVGTLREPGINNGNIIIIMKDGRT